MLAHYDVPAPGTPQSLSRIAIEIGILLHSLEQLTAQLVRLVELLQFKVIEPDAAATLMAHVDRHLTDGHRHERSRAHGTIYLRMGLWLHGNWLTGELIAVDQKWTHFQHTGDDRPALLLAIQRPVNTIACRMSFIEKLKFNADGLIPAIIQDAANGRVLMMAWMNRESVEKTVETGKTWFWSRSRKKFWMKGESSGHTQSVKDIAFDCDGDTLLIQVEQTGAACHEGYRSCFFRSASEDPEGFAITESQLKTSEEIYGKK